MASSRYIRSTWMLKAKTRITLPDFSCIRFFSDDEARELAKNIGWRRMYFDDYNERNFYGRTMKELSDSSIIEIFLHGSPSTIRTNAEKRADLFEKVAILSTTVALKKEELLRNLGIGQKSKSEIGFIISADRKRLSSRKVRPRRSRGIVIDNAFKTRFEKNQFASIYESCLMDNDIAARMTKSLSWLFESRREFDQQSSVIKTAIALESLLIFSGSEPLTHSLSERTAFLLTSNLERRILINEIIRKFYKTRSNIVHGSTKKRGTFKSSLIESTDRLTVLLLLTIANNIGRWPSETHLRNWFVNEIFDKPSNDIVRPFSQYYLSKAIKLGA